MSEPVDPAPESGGNPPPSPYWQPPQDMTGFSAMPGSGKGAVVMLWILFGLGICSSGVVIVVFGVLLALPQDVKTELHSTVPWLWPFFAFVLAQTVVWTVLRGVFAHRITRGHESARSGAVVLEVIGLALTVLTWIVLFSAVAAMGDDRIEVDTSAMNGGDLVGFALSCVVIGLLRTREVRAWCDR